MDDSGFLLSNVFYSRSLFGDGESGIMMQLSSILTVRI